MSMHWAMKLGLVAALGFGGLGISGCTSIRQTQGYVIDQALVQSVQPGIDNKRSVEATLGRPSFASEFGDPTWYYISSFTKQRPFGRPKIKTLSVLAVHFDAKGNVLSTERKGTEAIAAISPDGDKTPTLGRKRTFLQDLFGNIGTVGAPGAGGAGGGPGPGG